MSKTYRQYCGLAKALDVVGERWTLLIVRNLLLGPKRYSDLVEGLPGITTNLLAKRLKELEQADLVEKRTLPAPARVQVYALTATGAALEPAIMELARWGGRWMSTPRKTDRFDVAWGLLSMKRRYRGGAALSAELHVDDRVFAMEFEPRYLRVEERLAAAPRVTIQASTTALRDWMFGGEPIPDRAAACGVRLVGDDADVDAFCEAFGPPARILGK